MLVPAWLVVVGRENIYIYEERKREREIIEHVHPCTVLKDVTMENVAIKTLSLFPCCDLFDSTGRLYLFDPQWATSVAQADRGLSGLRG